LVDVVFDDDVRVVLIEDEDAGEKVIEPIEEAARTMEFPFVKLLLNGLFHALGSLLVLGKL
jgi:hypothetical protein